MDLATGAEQVWVMMTLFARDGTPKLVPQCSYPLEIRGEPEEDPGPAFGGDALVQLGEGAVPPGMSLKAFRDSVERAFILQRLSEQNWNVSKTAESLDVERTHLHKKMKLLGIARGG